MCSCKDMIAIPRSHKAKLIVCVLTSWSDHHVECLSEKKNNLSFLVLLLVLVVRHLSISGITVTDRNYSTLLRLFSTSCPQINGQILLFLNQMNYYLLVAGF